MSEMIRLNAGNDRNGNPRRVYVLVEAGAIMGVYDEGYAGPDVVPALYRNLAKYAPTFATAPSEYRALLKEYGVKAHPGARS